jgi:two-component system, NarL family, capsular synthesis sensor histidine kinase RcsC
LPRFPVVPATYRALFLRQLHDDIAALDQIRATRDVDAVRRWLHKLSGGLAILGPSALLEQCKALRSVLSNVCEVERRLNALRAELLVLRDQLQASRD